MPLKDAITTVLNRNVFYRDGYRLLLRISMIQGIAIVLLVGTIVVMLVTMETRHVYFATASDGRIINLVPLNTPFRTDAEVISWSANAIKNTLRFDYKDYKQRLQEASVNFTPSGWESFTRALKDARILDAIEARKLVVSLDLGAAPEIKDRGERNGVYSWYLQCPVQIKFDGNEPPTPIQANLIIQIVRVSTLNNPTGMGIEQWIVKQ